MHFKDIILNFEYKPIQLKMKKILNLVPLKVLVLVLFMCFNLSTRAQNENAQNNWKFSHPILVKQQEPTPPKTNNIKDRGKKPEFPGGNVKLKQYLERETHKILSRRPDNIFGKVVVGFEVSEKGNLSNFKIVKSTNPSLNEDALNIIKSMPNWKPAKRDGIKVKSKMNVIVNFE